MSMPRFSRGNLQFLMGFTLGLTVSLLLLSLQQLQLTSSRLHAAVPKDWMLEKTRMDVAAGDRKVIRGRSLASDLAHHNDDDSKAKELYKQVRVLVWVMTGPQNLDKRAVHVRDTWGKRANKLLFMSSEWNHTFPTIGLDVAEGRQHLTAKTMKAFQYVHELHLDDAEWFMKTDDDTYVIMENLRYMLTEYSPEDPIYFGKVFNIIVKQGYTSGGAGYVLSKEALRRLVSKGVNTSLCREDGGAEDVSIGKCLNNLGVKLLPSTDRLGRTRFHCFGPEAHIQGGFPKWFLHYDIHGGRAGMENISDYPISFHYIRAKSMYAMEYFIYHLRPYGIIAGPQDLNLHHKTRPSSR